MENKSVFFSEINPHALIALILKHVWVVVLMCISAVMCFSSVCRLTYVPEYTSTATFMVSAKDSTSAYNSLTTTQSMASVFVEVFQSNILREKIAEKMPEGTFDGVINTTTIPETNLLIVTVTASQPDTAFQALNLLVDNYSTISDYLFSNAQLEVIKDPVVPVGPSNATNLRVRAPWVAIAALVGTCAIIVAIYLLRHTVKTPSAARRRIDARLLRTIGHERKNAPLRFRLRRKSKAPLIVNRLIKKNFIEDNMSFCSTLEYHMRRHKQQVVLVTSVGENEGKSTVAANLALALAEKQYRVALLDCDDVWLPEKLEKQLALAAESGADVLYCSYGIVDERGHARCDDFIVPPQITYRETLSHSVISCSTALLSRRVVDAYRFRTDYYHEDLVLWLEILRDGYTAAGVTDVLAQYRVFEGTRSSNKLKSAARRWVVIRRCMREPLLSSIGAMMRYAWITVRKYKRV